MVTPNVIQEEALLHLSKSKQNGNNRFLVVMPSGVGKTHFSAFETISNKGNILYIAHRNEILKQARDIFQEVQQVKNEDIGFYNAKEKNLDKKLVFASIQTISRRKNLYGMKRDKFKNIIVDEWHHVGAETYQRVLNYFEPDTLIGLTATPYRGDGKDILSHVRYNVPYQMELQGGIRQRVLVPFIYYGLWDDVDYSDIKYRGHRYTEKDLNKKLLIDSRDKEIIKEFKHKIVDRKCIGFCVSVRHVARCVRLFNREGIHSVGIDYSLSMDDREEIVSDFREGKYQVVFTVDIFNEGVDFPEVSGLLFLRPTFSKRIFFQQLGRGLRRSEGKENVIVLDFIGNYVNAYERKIWLEPFIKSGDTRYQKPEYSYPISVVHFDSRVLELFAKQMILSDSDIVDAYWKLKGKLSRIPKSMEFEYIGYCQRRWGTWNKFLMSIGEEPNFRRNKTLHDFEEEYFRLKRISNS